MPYATTNPPSKISSGPIAGAGQIWYYSSTDALAAVNTAGYITNGGELGMKVGDTVTVNDSTTPLTSLHRVITVNATTGAVDLSDGVSLGANTD